MSQKNIKILVTGATGYLGTVLVKELYDAGHSVTSLALPGDDTSFVSPYSEIRYADVRDRDALRQQIIGFDLVIHLAGIVDVGSTKRALMKQVNIGGTRNVAELCMKSNIKMIYCSSVHALPCLPHTETMTEAADFDPARVRGSYGKSKAEATKMLLEMTGRGLQAMVAMPSGIIGPNERRLSNIGQLIVEYLCGNLKAYIDGKYNFVDVRDVASGIRGMAENWASGECYILSGNEVSVRDLIEGISKASGMRMPRLKMPYAFAISTSHLAELFYKIRRKRPLYTHYSIQTLRSNCSFSNGKAHNAFGYSVRSAQESLSEMTHWIMSHFVVKKKNRYKACFYRD